MTTTTLSEDLLFIAGMIAIGALVGMALDIFGKWLFKNPPFGAPAPETETTTTFKVGIGSETADRLRQIAATKYRAKIEIGEYDGETTLYLMLTHDLLPAKKANIPQPLRLDALRVKLDAAIFREDYESAAEIQKEINQLQKAKA